MLAELVKQIKGGLFMIKVINRGANIAESAKQLEAKFDPKEFIDDTVEDKWYPEKDYHYIYFAEIEKVLISE